MPFALLTGHCGTRGRMILFYRAGNVAARLRGAGNEILQKTAALEMLDLLESVASHPCQQVAIGG